MPSSPLLSKASASCQLEWRPSAWLIFALLSLGALGGASLLLSDFSRSLAWPGAVLAMGYAVMLSRREAGKLPIEIAFDDANVLVGDEAVHDFSVFWRGPWVFARWRDDAGRVQRVVWWPDTLNSASQRELRLALPTETAARSRRSVAP